MIESIYRNTDMRTFSPVPLKLLGVYVWVPIRGSLEERCNHWY